MLWLWVQKSFMDWWHPAMHGGLWLGKSSDGESQKLLCLIAGGPTIRSGKNIMTRCDVTGMMGRIRGIILSFLSFCRHVTWMCWAHFFRCSSSSWAIHWKQGICRAYFGIFGVPHPHIQISGADRIGCGYLFISWNVPSFFFRRYNFISVCIFDHCLKEINREYNLKS